MYRRSGGHGGDDLGGTGDMWVFSAAIHAVLCVGLWFFFVHEFGWGAEARGCTMLRQYGMVRTAVHNRPQGPPAIDIRKIWGQYGKPGALTPYGNISVSGWGFRVHEVKCTECGAIV